MQKFILPHIKTVPGNAIIIGQDARHIVKVLRLKPGDRISLTNGKGIDYTAQIDRCQADKVELEIFESSPSKTESQLSITLCSGMLKDKKMDLVIKHVTQLGVHRWIPFYCDRSVPKHNKNRMDKKMTRWQSIARESLKQCRRSLLPEIAAPVSFEETLSLVSDTDLKIAFWENATQRTGSLKSSESLNSVTVLIGPEGGLTESEIHLAQSKGFSVYFLGPRILRAETAAISSCTLIQHLFGDI